jgi:hypothetical protein
MGHVTVSSPMPATRDTGASLVRSVGPSNQSKHLGQGSTLVKLLFGSDSAPSDLGLTKLIGKRHTRNLVKIRKMENCVPEFSIPFKPCNRGACQGRKKVRREISCWNPLTDLRHVHDGLDPRGQCSAGCPPAMPVSRSLSGSTGVVTLKQTFRLYVSNQIEGFL